MSNKPCIKCGVIDRISDGRCHPCKKIRDKEDSRKRRKNAPYKYETLRRKSTYGITQEQYEGLIFKQNNQCAICKLEKKLVVDHCHITKIVRGLICQSCNIALGNFKDNIANLKEAIKYLAG